MAATLFPIMLEVEETAVGAVLRLVKDYPGIAKVHLDLDNVGKKPGKRIGENGTVRASHNPDAPPAKSVIITELSSGPKNLQHLRTTYAELGGRAGSVSSALYDLQKKGVTESAGVGLHRLTPEAMEEMKAQQPVATVALPAPDKKDRTASKTFVLKAVEDGLSRAEMRVKGEPLGIGERMIDGALTRLKVAKVIIPYGNEPGRFKLVPAKPPKSKSKTPTPDAE